jgi:hypothetical protein
MVLLLCCLKDYNGILCMVQQLSSCGWNRADNLYRGETSNGFPVLAVAAVRRLPVASGD